MTTRRRRADIEDEESPKPNPARDWEPACVRCGRSMPGYHALFGLCQTCIEAEQAELKAHLRAIQDGRVPRVKPEYVPGHTPTAPSRPLWDAKELTPKAILARKAIGLPAPVDQETEDVPF